MLRRANISAATKKHKPPQNKEILEIPSHMKTVAHNLTTSIQDTVHESSKQH